MTLFANEVLLDSQIFQRRHRRVPINQYVRIFHKDTKHFIGRLMDVTPYGFRLSTYESIKDDSLKEFELSDWISDRSPDLTLEARSIWCQENGTIGLFDVGFELIYSSAGAQSKIKDLITYH